MDKRTRKSDIGYLALSAAMAFMCSEKPGVCSVHYWTDRRGDKLKRKPGVHLLASQFLEYFGEDTNYEYLEDDDGDRQMVTEVNGVVFYALVGYGDDIENGVLI